jgi:hypothetical protein
MQDDLSKRAWRELQLSFIETFSKLDEAEELKLSELLANANKNNQPQGIIRETINSPINKQNTENK